MIDFSKPIECKFSDGSNTKVFIIGQHDNGDWEIGISNPNDDSTGIMVRVNDTGKSIKTNRQVVWNVT